MIISRTFDPVFRSVWHERSDRRTSFRHNRLSAPECTRVSSRQGYVRVVPSNICGNTNWTCFLLVVSIMIRSEMSPSLTEPPHFSDRVQKYHVSSPHPYLPSFWPYIGYHNLTLIHIIILEYQKLFIYIFVYIRLSLLYDDRYLYIS